MSLILRAVTPTPLRAPPVSTRAAPPGARAPAPADAPGRAAAPPASRLCLAAGPHGRAPTRRTRCPPRSRGHDATPAAATPIQAGHATADEPHRGSGRAPPARPVDPREAAGAPA